MKVVASHGSHYNYHEPPVEGGIILCLFVVFSGELGSGQVKTDPIHDVHALLAATADPTTEVRVSNVNRCIPLMSPDVGTILPIPWKATTI